MTKENNSKLIEIHLNNGMTFTATVEGYTGANFAEQLNNPNVNHVNIGDLVIGKHSVILAVPVDAVQAEPE